MRVLQLNRQVLEQPMRDPLKRVASSSVHWLPRDQMSFDLQQLGKQQPYHQVLELQSKGQRRSKQRHRDERVVKQLKGRLRPLIVGKGTLTLVLTKR